MLPLGSTLTTLPYSTTTISTVNWLQQKTIHPDLGVVVSSDLQWKSHYLFILPKSYKILGLLRRVFSSVNCVRAKKVLYLSLVRSKLLYCSPIWRPHLLSDVRALGKCAEKSYKFNLNDSLSNYCLRLMNLNLLPLMMVFEMNDIIFFIKYLKHPSEYFDIFNYVF